MSDTPALGGGGGVMVGDKLCAGFTVLNYTKYIKCNWYKFWVMQ